MQGTIYMALKNENIYYLALYLKILLTLGRKHYPHCRNIFWTML